jgi:hypothetical protein
MNTCNDDAPSFLDFPFATRTTREDAEAIAAGEIAFAVVGLGPNPDADNDRSDGERLIDALAGVVETCKVAPALGSFRGVGEPALVVYGCPWPVRVAVRAGSEAGQLCVYSHVPGSAASLVDVDGNGWTPLGNQRPGPSPDGDCTWILDRDGNAHSFHAGPGPGSS